MQKPPMAATRDDPPQMIARSETHSPALSTATFRHELGGPQTLGPTDYFPGVIDTSTSRRGDVTQKNGSNVYRSLGPEGL